MLFLDTDVMIDILREYPPAVAWLRAQPVAPSVCGLMELVQSRESVRAARRVRMSLRPFAVYWPTEADCARALETYTRGHFSHSLGIMDALIGECAVGLGVPLVTFNVRHYRAITALVTEQPYGRA